MREFKIGDKVKIPSEPDSEWVSTEYNETVGLLGEVIDELSDGEILVSFPCSLGVFYYHPSYLLTEPYNQSEQPMKEFISKDHNPFSNEIDLEKEQVFTDPLEGYLFDLHFKGSLKAIMKDDVGQLHFFDEECGRWSICEKIQETPKPKTRPKTHFEILKMDARFRNKRNGNTSNNWNSNYDDPEENEFCLTVDFKKAKSLEDVVWKPLTTEEV